MDYQKDNQNKGFNSKGQSGHQGHFRHTEKEQGSREMMREQRVRDNFEFIVKKSEKLTTALYLVTDILPPREPMKWKSREIAVDLLSDLTITSGLSTSEKMTGLENAARKAEKIMAFLDVAQSAHLISEMNSSVLKKEYGVLKDTLEREWRHIHEKSHAIFSGSFFDVPREVHLKDKLIESRESVKIIEREHANGGVPPKTEEKISQVTPPPARPTERKIESGDVNRVSIPVHIEPKSEAPRELMRTPASSLVIPPRVTERHEREERTSIPLSEIISRGRSDVERDDRRKIILALINQKPALTVKDIAKSIPHVSEKTIQRELLSMVSEGILMKKGERRWSTYSLNK